MSRRSGIPREEVFQEEDEAQNDDVTGTVRCH